MKKFIVLLVMGLVGLFAWGVQGEGPDITISVMSYNILRPAWSQPADPPWSNRVEGIVSIINSRKPDVIGLQEENEEMVTDLLQRLQGDYAYLFPVPLNGNGILFRYREWTPSETRRRLTVDGGWIVEALMEGPQGQTFYLYNVHPSPFEEWKRMLAMEVLRQMITERNQKNLPVVVLGDLNALDTSEPIRLLTDPTKTGTVRDVFSVLHPGEKASATADAYGTRELGPNSRIDYVLFNGPLEPLSYTVVEDKPFGTYPSDHFPVLVTFKGLP